MLYLVFVSPRYSFKRIIYVHLQCNNAFFHQLRNRSKTCLHLSRSFSCPILRHPTFIKPNYSSARPINQRTNAPTSFVFPKLLTYTSSPTSPPSFPSNNFRICRHINISCAITVTLTPFGPLFHVSDLLNPTTAKCLCNTSRRKVYNKDLTLDMSLCLTLESNRVWQHSRLQTRILGVCYVCCTSTHLPLFELGKVRIYARTLEEWWISSVFLVRLNTKSRTRPCEERLPLM